MPTSGRFLAKDNWGGDTNNPVSFNLWLYAAGNPINNVDPTGQCWVIRNGDGKWYPNGTSYCPPDVNGYNEKISPPGISWFPAVDPLANGASGIPRNTNAAQFLDSKYDSCPNGNCYHFGLCGEGVLSAITGLPIQAIAKMYIFGVQNGLMATKDSPPDYTGPGTMVAIVNNLLNGNGLHAEGNSWVTFQSRRSLLANQIHTWLSQGSIPIPAVTIVSGSSRPESADIAGKVGLGTPTHWVAITGMSNQWSKANGGYLNDDSPWNWVRIFNPFDNQTEYYYWKDFELAWAKAKDMMVLVSQR